ncbi:MAG: metallophosphoesterase [Clostridia bacterium]|nr:metallophosphoesterase [Clostridia bacterium]
MRATHYTFHTNGRVSNLTVAVCADLHDRVAPAQKAISLLQDLRPDLIFLPGDIVENHPEPYGCGFAFLRDLCSIAPCYMSLGNHETGGRHYYRKGTTLLMNEPNSYRNFITDIKATGVVLLDQSYVETKGLIVGGISSHLFRNADEKLDHHPIPTAFLEDFSSRPGFHVLLCHHPEIFPQIAAHPIELTLCGHAHGGQIRLFGRGLFAPGQGLFPKWTNGLLELPEHPGHKMLVSRGMANNTPIPRFFNPTQIPVIHFV